MKPYNIKGAAMPMYAILARVTDIGTVHAEYGKVKVHEAHLWQNQAT